MTVRIDRTTRITAYTLVRFIHTTDYRKGVHRGRGWGTGVLPPQWLQSTIIDIIISEEEMEC